VSRAEVGVGLGTIWDFFSILWEPRGDQRVLRCEGIAELEFEFQRRAEKVEVSAGANGIGAQRGNLGDSYLMVFDASWRLGKMWFSCVGVNWNSLQMSSKWVG